jgi:hypothetical protein
MKLHEHCVCEHHYAGMEIVDTMCCLLPTASASRRGDPCGTCGAVHFNHVSEVSERFCEMILKPRISGSSLHSAALY